MSTIPLQRTLKASLTFFQEQGSPLLLYIGLPYFVLSFLFYISLYLPPQFFLFVGLLCLFVLPVLFHWSAFQFKYHLQQEHAQRASFLLHPWLAQLGGAQSLLFLIFISTAWLICTFFVLLPIFASSGLTLHILSFVSSASDWTPMTLVLSILHFFQMKSHALFWVPLFFLSLGLLLTPWVLFICFFMERKDPILALVSSTFIWKKHFSAFTKIGIFYGIILVLSFFLPFIGIFLFPWTVGALCLAFNALDTSGLPQTL